MGTLIFKSPKNPAEFRKLLAEANVKIIRDNVVIHRPFIIQHDGLQAIDNGCKARIVKVFSNKNKDHDIIVVGHKWLDFHSLIINYKGLAPYLITKQEDLTNYLK